MNEPRDDAQLLPSVVVDLTNSAPFARLGWPLACSDCAADFETEGLVVRAPAGNLCLTCSGLDDLV